MVVYCVDVLVVKGREDDFMEASKENRKGTRKESGNLRFDILQKEENPSGFLLYEVYASEEAVAAHKQTPHYFAWRDAVAPMMARPRKGVKYRQVSSFE